MRSRLLSSFLFVLGFWWLVTALYWSVSDPAVNLESLRKVIEVFPWVDIQPPSQVNVLHAWDIQKQVLQYWSGPVVLVTFMIAGLGGGIVWLRALSRHKERAERIKSPTTFRGIALSLGPLPQPSTPKLQPVALRATDKALQGLTAEELALLTEVLGLFAANRDCFAGNNEPAGSLLTRILKATYAALRNPQHPGAAAIVTAASELGKLTAWKKDEHGAWLRIRHEQREAARLLSALPAWWALPEVERQAILLAVKYRGQIAHLPEGKNPAVYRMARSLLEHQPAPTSTSAVTEEAQIVAYEQRDPEVELFEVFERELALMPFQTMGLPKNIPAVGWKKGNRAFFLENRLTEHLLSKLRPDLKAAYAPSEEKVRVQKLTAVLLKLFQEKQWLVREHEKNVVPAHEALWVIKAGKLEFSRVIILDLPDEVVSSLPPKDSYYEVTITRPLFQQPLNNSISKDDLMGGMLRPKSNSPKAEKQEKAEAPVVKDEDPAQAALDSAASEPVEEKPVSEKPVREKPRQEKSAKFAKPAGGKKLLDPSTLF
jgi:hypothetical protein